MGVEVFKRRIVTPDVLGNEQEIEHVTKTITSAQILALFATPIEVIAAPGAGKALILEGALLFLDHGGTDYAGIAAGEDLSFKYTNAAGAEVMRIETTGFMDASADALRYARPTDLTNMIPVHTPIANAAIVLHLLVAEIITGDSPLIVRTYYRVVPTTLP